MQKAFRSIKNEVKRYDEGQRMIRQLTSNEDTIPPEEDLEALVRYCRNDMITNPTYETLWERLQDFKNLRHVEKSLLVIEHLILYGTKKFIRLCLLKKPLLLKLSKYVYKVDGSDIGQNVRRRAKYCHDLLQNEDILNKDGIGKYRSGSIGAPRKDAVRSYDAYFQDADVQDQARKQAFGVSGDSLGLGSDSEAGASAPSGAAASPMSEKRKKKKKKKRRNSDESEESEEEESRELRKPRKKSKRRRAKEEDDDPFGRDDPFGDDDDYKDVISEQDIKAALSAAQSNPVSTDDLFADTTNDDPFWNDTSDNAAVITPPEQPPQPVQAAPQPEVANGGSDDLMDFFSAPPSQQQHHQQQQMNVYQQNMNQNGMNQMNGYQNPYGFGGNPYMQQQPVQQPVMQQPPMQQNGFGNYSDNPFSNSNPMPSNQMTFSTASIAERNRLKQLEMRNTQNVHSNMNGMNGQNGFTSNDPFAAHNFGDDPFGNSAAAKQQNQNANDDPFAVWGL